jgi:hypothetical protein
MYFFPLSCLRFAMLVPSAVESVIGEYILHSFSGVIEISLLIYGLCNFCSDSPFTDQEELDEIEDEDRTEQEPDLKMLRRRLRPHRCQWVGCIGPPVLASVELLGVHLNKKHLNTKDPGTVSILYAH